MTEHTDFKGLDFDQARQWVQAHLPTPDARVASPVPPSLTAVDGFLFAVSQAPVPVSASEWLGDLLPLFPEGSNTLTKGPSEALNAILSLQHHIERRCEAQDYPVPNTTGMDAIAQIQPGQPLNDWSLGFEAGFEHVRGIWDRLIPGELRSELDSQLFALTFFATPDKARRFLVRRETEMRPEQLADQVLAQFPKAVDLHARLSISVGHVAQKAVREPSTIKAEKVGRNDPCPCGSGKKYKHCCLQ